MGSSPRLKTTSSARQSPPRVPAPQRQRPRARMQAQEQVFTQALPLWVGFVALPDWRGPIAATCTAVRSVVAIRRAHALRTCPSAHGTGTTYRGRLRIDECSGCGQVKPVYPLRRASVVRLYHETLQQVPVPAENAGPRTRWPGNRVACAILESPGHDGYAGDPDGIVAWLCDQRQCGGAVWIADPERNVLLRRGAW